jgi:hypothetical protein
MQFVSQRNRARFLTVVALAALAACGGGGGGGGDGGAGGATAGTSPAAAPTSSAGAASGSGPASGTDPALATGNLAPVIDAGAAGPGTAPVPAPEVVSAAPPPAPLPADPVAAPAPEAPAAGLAPVPPPPPAAPAPATPPPPAPAVVPTRLTPAEFRVNTTAAGVQFGGGITRLAGGGYVAVWQSSPVVDNSFLDYTNSSVVFQRYDANGNPVGPEISAALEAHTPGVTALANGEFLITWSQRRYQYEANGFARRYGADGIPVGPPITLARSFYSYTAKPTALRGGGFVLAINGITGRFGTGYGAFQLYNPDATPQGAPIVLNEQVTDTSTWVQVTGATPLDDGGFALVWREGGSVRPQRAMTRTFAADGTPRGQPVEIPAEGFSPQVLTLANGNYGVIWESVTATGRQLTMQLMDRTGAALASRVLVEAVRTSGSNALNPKAAPLLGGGFVVTYTVVDDDTDTALSYRTLAQRYNDAGQPQNSQETIAFNSVPKPFVGGNTLEVTGATFDNFIVLSGAHSPTNLWDLRATIR